MTNFPPSHPVYESRQYSWVLITVCVLAELLLAYFSWPPSLSSFFLLVLFPVMLLLFASQYFVLTGDAVYLSYGIGAFAWEIELSEIQSVVLAPQAALIAWLFDPLSSEVLQIVLRSGKTIRVGVQDKRRLVDLLRARVDARI